MSQSTRILFGDEPAKVALCPPGFQSSSLAPPGLVPPSFQPAGFPSSPPGLNSAAETSAYAYMGMDLNYHSSAHMFDAQTQSWADHWEMAEYDSWDQLYETCTEAASWPYNVHGITQASCLSPKSDVSEGTDSTTDTCHGAGHEMMAEGIVIDALSKALQGGPREQQHAIDCITEQLQTLCKTQQGSLLAQSAVVLAAGSQLDALLVKLSGFVIEASKSPHGNHVVQKCIDVLGHTKAQFVVDGLVGRAVAVARDRFGCRIMEHLIDSCSQKQVSGLIDELMMDAKRLCRHPFANYVMQSVVKFGTPARRAQVAEVLVADAPRFARHRFALHVFQLAVKHCEPVDSTRLIQESKRPAKYIK